ncbi:MAG: hypothetical protein WAV00_06355 [Nocardioides sp.]
MLDHLGRPAQRLRDGGASEGHMEHRAVEVGSGRQVLRSIHVLAGRGIVAGAGREDGGQGVQDRPVELSCTV